MSYQEEKLLERGPSPPFSTISSPPNVNQLPWLEKQLAIRLTVFKEELNGLQHKFHPSCIRIYFSFVKNTLVCKVQIPLNTLIASPALHKGWSVGMIEKGSPMNFIAANPWQRRSAEEGLMLLPGPPPTGEKDGKRIFEDNIIWYLQPWQLGRIAEKGVAAGTGGK